MTDVLLAGFAPHTLPYADGLRLQREIHAEVVAGVRPETVILCEHDSVYTAGSRTEPGDLPRDGSPVIDVDRGGRITWHGPGQLVGYPIVRLAEYRDVVGHVRRLEQVMIDVAAQVGVVGIRITGRSGVWVDSPTGAVKIGAVGVRVVSGTTLHGFALNCSNSLAAYDTIVPCGISDAGVSTLSIVAGRRMVPADVADMVTAAFASEQVPA
ncbi:lipoyl(octanoyl) transferase [Labedella gwakjiensis]|uniref:Octanoyltransferase n=1 Tax=Labedella gwakjiensis TaxID=390269 RepID=A0A2P8H0P4_9MICO|nr:lipoyl(octanoyl) transferase LipB [Labedella gwakjiensis]PSL39787.1 lipoyl(octanoyl) transferase [Labedella gwakjiensis]RUQ85833.1 lipoyl(octanoyl) transferase LipB [Labedella gwakjiensis]